MFLMASSLLSQLRVQEVMNKISNVDAPDVEEGVLGRPNAPVTTWGSDVTPKDLVTPRAPDTADKPKAKVGAWGWDEYDEGKDKKEGGDENKRPSCRNKRRAREREAEEKAKR